MELKERIQERIKDLEQQQQVIIDRIKQSNPSVGQIINYGQDLNKMDLIISQLQLLLWQ